MSRTGNATPRRSGWISSRLPRDVRSDAWLRLAEAGRLHALVVLVLNLAGQVGRLAGHHVDPEQAAEPGEICVEVHWAFAGPEKRVPAKVALGPSLREQAVLQVDIVLAGISERRFGRGQANAAVGPGQPRRRQQEGADIADRQDTCETQRREQAARSLLRGRLCRGAGRVRDRRAPGCAPPVAGPFGSLSCSS